MFNYYRVCTAVPDVKVADVEYNTDRILDILKKAKEQDTDVICFPELCITGYTCGDLFFQEILLEKCKCAIGRILEETTDLDMVIAIGAPCKIEHQLFNSAYILHKGRICGINITAPS